MIRKIKTFLVNLLPAGLSLPVRFMYNRLTGRLEPEIALLPQLVRKGSLALDVGANIGFYGYALHRAGVQVECFEPVPGCASVIQAYGAPGINVHCMGLSDAQGEAQLFVPQRGGRLATAQAHLGSGGISLESGSATLAVELRTMDSFGFDDVSFIKIDVEGHELRVLKGGRETILRNRPVLLVEIEQRHLQEGSIEDVFSYVRSLGYSGSFLRDGREVPLSAFDVQRDQLGRESQLESGDERGYINNFIFRPVARPT
ncbi:MAG: FkbM family methyltransferase [Pseudomonadota bacterium]